MFAENYPYMPFTREMRRRYQAGDIGEVRYAEAEYLDEPADLASMVNDRAHWRARTPATYYCTHSLAPVVWDVVDEKEGRRVEEVIRPWPPEFPATDADPMGDGVAETLMLRDFADAVRHRTPPDQDVYFGVGLSITGIQAMHSSLAGSLPVEVPDLRRLEVRRAYAADSWFPDLPEL